MFNQGKAKKGSKKVTTKPGKVAGQPSIPKYLRETPGIMPLDLLPKARKEKK